MYTTRTTPAVSLAGVNISRFSFKETLEWINERLKNATFTQVATANMDFLDLCAKKPELRTILNHQCHLVTADGMPLVWLSRTTGLPIPERVAGSDLVPEITRLAAEQGLSVFFLGGNPNATVAAVRMLREQHPTLKVAGMNCSRFDVNDAVKVAAIAEEIRLSKAHILFVALGCPKQERFIADHAERIGIRFAMGVGGSFDFIAGVRERAPRWMQRSGLEWVCRMAQEPGRLAPRYGRNLIRFARLAAGMTATRVMHS